MNQLGFKLVRLVWNAGECSLCDGLDGLSATRLDEAHCMAQASMCRSDLADGACLYGDGSNWIELPQSIAGSAYATLSTEILEPGRIARIAQIVAHLGCEFVPLDGGPWVRPDPQELLFELGRRALIDQRKSLSSR
ncbi:hypothetical protein GT347_10875 [Xylophilus rhododendri]|uniref:Uncharacterized protein n=1 Tax=Xylophilus rhododendri TaxID=2697032 RepID=A0A857J5F4_9BURK|nr:hypothetical protein [Xylophilus rhododendri]QHI98453.1 hypothetical protein GT347_10875 [Xylophilus rhododendri]